MKMIPGINGLDVPVSNEEYTLLQKVNESFDDSIDYDELEPREQELAENLHARGVLNKSNKNNKFIFTRIEE